jgi:hypothetical protein
MKGYKMNNPDMTGFATFTPTAETVDELKKTWAIYSCNGWIAKHKESGKKIKCGTYYALLQALHNWKYDYSKIPG